MGAQYDHPGTFHISGSTQSAHTVDTLKAVRDELDKMRTSRSHRAGTANRQGTVLNSFVFFFDRPSKTLNRVMRYEYYGYPKDFIFQYQKAIAAVTNADVLRVAQGTFPAGGSDHRRGGKSKEFGTPLSALGAGTAARSHHSRAEANHRKADAASLAKGKRELQRAQQALGGAEKLAAVKDLEYHAEVEVQSPGGPVMNVKQTNSYLASGSMRQEIELPFGKQWIYSDGNGDG